MAKGKEMEVERKSTPGKETRRMYLIFFAIGALSVPISLLLGRVLTSANILRLEGVYQVLFALSVCAFLFAIEMYFFKERSFILAVEAFAIAIVAAIAIFYGSIFFGLFLAGKFVFLFPFVLLLILFVIGMVAFKDIPLIGFTLRAFVVSFAAVLLIFNAYLLFGAYQQEHAKWVEVDELTDIPSEYVEMADTELERFPALKEALAAQNPVKTPPEEWRNLEDLIKNKSLTKYSDTRISTVKIGEKYYSIGFMTA